MNKKWVNLSLYSAFLTLLPPANSAESIEETIVTAQKRPQDLQNVPIAITVFDQEQLNDQKIYDIYDISATTPNLQVARSLGGNTGATITIRGIGQPNPSPIVEPSTGIYLDGVFIPKNAGGLFDVAELTRIEVLKGPQGSLYGKNTIAGAINLITRKPGDELSGFIKAGFGNYTSHEYAASFDTGTIADTLKMTIALSKRDHKGFVKNTYPAPDMPNAGSLDSESARLGALYEPSDELSIYYSFDWSKRDNTPVFPQYEPLVNGKAPKPDRDSAGQSDVVGYDKSKGFGHALQVNWLLSDSLTLTSTTAYRGLNFDDSLNGDGMPILAMHGQRHMRHKQTSQEFQLQGENERLDYVVGLYYFNDDTDVANPIAANLIQQPMVEYTRNYYGTESESIALYGQTDIFLTRALTATLGARWTYEAKDSYAQHEVPMTYYKGGIAQTEVYDVKAAHHWNHFSPSFTLAYDSQKGFNSYLRIARGWKAGGFNGEAITEQQARTPYDEETVTSYEVGIKSRWLDDRLQVNTALFFNDVTDMQVFSFLAAYTNAENAGKAHIKGLELETLFLLTDTVTGFINYGYTDAKYIDFAINQIDMKDTAIFPYTPKHTASAGFDYKKPFTFGTLKARLDYTYRSKQYFFYEPENYNPTRSDAVSLVNARLAMTDITLGNRQTFDMGVWAKNLTNAAYRNNGLPSPGRHGANYYGDPRTFGVDLTYRF